MTVFVWISESARREATNDVVSTIFATPTASCLFCGESFKNGDRVWHWHIDGRSDIRAHAKCASGNARGMIKDLAECTR
jgi:hypothetical protein